MSVHAYDLSPRLCWECKRHPSNCICPDERLTVRSRDRRRIVQPCDCDGDPFCEFCGPNGEAA